MPMPRRLYPILTAALALFGCAPSLSTARGAVNAVSSLYEATKGPLEQRYEQDQLACLDQRPAPPEPCVASVRRSWKPVKDAEGFFYRTILLAQSVVGTAEAAAAIGRKADVLQLMVVVSSAVEAGERLRDAIQELHRSTEAPPAAPFAPAPAPSPFIPWPGPTAPARKPAGGAS